MKGSGKTTTLLTLIEKTKPVGHHRMVILDTKQVGDFSGYPVVTELEKLAETVDKNPITVYAPNKNEVRNRDYHEGFFEWCYDRWNTTVIVDELTQIVWGNDVPDSYMDITDRGRARHVSIWQGNQKPVFVPHAALSEADHFFVHDLLVKRDREKMVDILGTKIRKRIPDKHGFWYFYRTMTEPIYVPGFILNKGVIK